MAVGPAWLPERSLCDDAFGAGDLDGCADGLAEEIGMKGISQVLLPLQLGNGPSELAAQRSQRGEGGFLALSPETVQHAPKDSRLSSSMNVRVVTTEVAQAGLQPIGSLFEDEKVVSLLLRDGIGE